MSNREDRPVVWIADDSQIEAKITQRALGDAYAFEYFRDGALVLERLANGAPQPDLLLLDWVMPEVSGDEVLRFLRKQPATIDLPVILVTASRIETADVVQGLTIGANDYVARPFVAEELRARVDSAIRAKRLRERAVRERNRLAVINKLGRAFVDAGPRVDAVLEVLAQSLVGGICDACTITIVSELLPAKTIAHHHDPAMQDLVGGFTASDPCVYEFRNDEDARARLPPAYHAAIDRCGISALAVVPFPARSPLTGMITVLRERGGSPFEPEDLVTIETCLEYAGLAFEKALRFDAERALRKQLETILENMPIGIIVADASGELTHVNHTALDLLPDLRAAHCVDDMYRLFSPSQEGETLPITETPVRRALRGETVRGVEVELDVDDGTARFVRASAVGLPDATGRITSAILAYDDVTAAKLAAVEREQATELQRYVLGIVSHDLRSPLQTLSMGCEFIKLQVPDHPKVIPLVQRMESTTSRMRDIIEQLLDVVRTQLGGGIPVTPSDVGLDEVVRSVVSELSLAYPDARFEQHLDQVRGSWDRGRLAQVVANLLGNAIQHGVQQAPVTVETELAGDHALLRVSNRTAIVLTADQRERIFSPFRRTKAPTSSSSGLGLGLYIASEILKAHDGNISVESDATATTFTVRLPLAPGAA